MKPPDKIRDELVRGWLLKAEEDFSAANSLITYGDTFLSTVGFHSQQAAEKYLKAFLTSRQVEFPKTHDIDKLLDLVAMTDGNLAKSLRDTIVLTNYSVDARYPGDFSGVTGNEARQAIKLAEKVRDSILKLI